MHINLSGMINTDSVFSKVDQLSGPNTDGAIYAGNLTEDKNDDIGTIKAAARKKAMKSIMDQYESDKTIDDSLSMKRQHQAELARDMGEAQKQVNNLLESKDKIIEEYPDMEEQINDAVDYWNNKIKESVNAISEENGAIFALKQENAKNHGMVDAEKTADKIIDAASSDVIGTLLNEAKAYVDDKIEEAVEKAEDIAEEKEEKTEAADSEKIVSEDANVQEMLNDLKKYIKEESILPSDATGIAVDTQI